MTASTVWLVAAAPMALPPPPAFLKPLALASGTALSAFNGVLREEKGEIYHWIWGAGPNLELKEPQGPVEPHLLWDARSEASYGLRVLGSFLI